MTEKKTSKYFLKIQYGDKWNVNGTLTPPRSIGKVGLMRHSHPDIIISDLLFDQDTS